MDDLTRILRALNDTCTSHHVAYMNDPDSGRATYANISGWWLYADFTRTDSGTWHLHRGWYRGIEGSVEGLIQCIEVGAR